MSFYPHPPAVPLLNCALCGGPGELVAASSPFTLRGACAQCGMSSSPALNSKSHGAEQASSRWNATQTLIGAGADSARRAQELEAVVEALRGEIAELRSLVSRRRARYYVEHGAAMGRLLPPAVHSP